MYFLPETKEEFEEMKLGGIYSEVTKQYRPQELVLELSVYWHKKNAILKGIDSNGICYLKELLSDQNAKPKKFKKKLEEIEPIEDIGGVSIFNKEVFFPNSLSEARCNYEWSMYVGVGNEQTKENILNGLKNAIKSAYYNEVDICIYICVYIYIYIYSLLERKIQEKQENIRNIIRQNLLLVVSVLQSLKLKIYIFLG